VQSDVRKTVVDAEWHWAESSDGADAVLVAAHLQSEIASGLQFLWQWLRCRFVMEVDKAVVAFPGVILLGQPSG
jgi:hypothetical protein